MSEENGNLGVELEAEQKASIQLEAWAVDEELTNDEGHQFWSTKDYDKFSRDAANRELVPDHVEELVEAIREKNLLREYPIVVDKDFCIIDGQHRWQVAKILGVSLYYIMTDRMSIDDVASTNSQRRGWSAVNYLHYYCVNGVADYISLREFWTSHDFLSLSACRLLTSGNAQRGDGSFEHGRFTISRMRLAEKAADCLLMLSHYEIRKEKKYLTRNGTVKRLLEPKLNLHKRFQLVTAVLGMVSNAKYDPFHMENQVSSQGGVLRQCINAQSYLDLLTMIYNRNQRGKRLLFRLLSGRKIVTNRKLKGE